MLKDPPPFKGRFFFAESHAVHRAPQPQVFTKPAVATLYDLEELSVNWIVKVPVRAMPPEV
jgi:hypothetical protein